MESGLLYNPIMKQTNLRAGCKSALQLGTMTGRRSETLEHSYIFSLPRIRAKDFPYIKGKIDRSIGINYSSVNLNGLKSFFVRGTQRQFSENICSEDDLRCRIFGTFVVKFLACLPLLGFWNI